MNEVVAGAPVNQAMNGTAFGMLDGCEGFVWPSCWSFFLSLSVYFVDVVSSPYSFLLCAVPKSVAVRNAKNVACVAVIVMMMTFVKNIVSA